MNQYFHIATLSKRIDLGNAGYNVQFPSTSATACISPGHITFFRFCFLGFIGLMTIPVNVQKGGKTVYWRCSDFAPLC
jgi:hypothetical protein